MKKIGLLLLVLLLLVLLPIPRLALAQTDPSSNASASATETTAAYAALATSAPAQVITLGGSVAPLTGPWKFSPGDSPWVNGSPVWAQPGFDDSKWAVMDMTPKPGAVDMQFGTKGFVPGWTTKGFPNLSRYAWYRLRVKVADANEPLWLKMPIDFDDGYQVYANGQYVGECGGFGRSHVRLYFSHPLSFALPPPGSDGVLELALRFYMSPATRYFYSDVGGMHEVPMLGGAFTVQLLQGADKVQVSRHQFGTVLTVLLFLLIAPMALWAWLRNRQERMYLWLFLALGCTILAYIADLVAESTYLLSYATGLSLRDISLLILPLWVMFWWHWFNLRGTRWIIRAAWLLTAARVVTVLCTLSPTLGFDLLPLHLLHGVNLISFGLTIAIGALVAALLVEGIRHNRAEALLAVVPILLLEISTFNDYLLSIFHQPTRFYPLGFGIGIGDLADILMGLVVGVVALRRFVRTQVRQEVARKAIAQDLDQARELQHRVLVPEALTSPFFTVETEYRPAQTVGGDFFQTLTRPDGSLLVVIGDVSGKGISAAMLVAVLVGTIRNQAKQSFDPTAMLTMLNESLMGRSGGHFATCIVAEIRPDGKMRIANAGHLPPYLNGKETVLEGSLPLGMIGEAEYFAENLTLQPGDRLIFMTDGVVEATNAAKELFGFERTRAISGQGAAAIAEQARRFGQEDDITVLGVAFAV
ncbi:MAG: PP2C family protein-serine/threonine phosphatase [Silvibacterium sp.]